MNKDHLEKKKYKKLSREIFRLLYKRPILKSDSESLGFIIKELHTNVPQCFQESALNVLGWLYHLEFEFSPWQDDDNLYYKDESYVQKKYLSQTRFGTYNLRGDIFKELLSNKLKL